MSWYLLLDFFQIVFGVKFDRNNGDHKAMAQCIVFLATAAGVDIDNRYAFALYDSAGVYSHSLSEDMRVDSDIKNMLVWTFGDFAIGVFRRIRELIAEKNTYTQRDWCLCLAASLWIAENHFGSKCDKSILDELEHRFPQLFIREENSRALILLREEVVYDIS
jgi:Uncharacterized conserved protein